MTGPLSITSSILVAYGARLRMKNEKKKKKNMLIYLDVTQHTLERL